jgi:hypothetical protein
VTPDEAWEDLNDALEEYRPACRGDAVFTAEQLTPEQRAYCASICATCPVLDLCDAYAATANVKAGYWGGHFYHSKGRT